jgi:hypothetical protein
MNHLRNDRKELESVEQTSFAVPEAVLEFDGSEQGANTALSHELHRFLAPATVSLVYCSVTGLDIMPNPARLIGSDSRAKCS